MPTVRFSSYQLWLIQKLMQLSEPAGTIADIRPLGRDLSERLLEVLYRACQEGLSEVDVELGREDAIKLAVVLKPDMRDERGLSVKDLIVACLKAAFEPDFTEIEKWLK